MHPLPQHHTKLPHLAFLAEASQILSRSLDPSVTVDEVGRLFVPYIADLCIVDILEGATWRRKGVTHVDEQKREALRLQSPTEGITAIYAEILRTGEPQFLPEPRAGNPFNDVVNKGAKSLTGGLPMTSAMAIPLGASGGRAFGVMFLSCHQSERQFSDEDFLLAQEVARRAGTHIDNARLFQDAECARADAESARRRSVYLTRVSDTLAAPLLYKEVIEQVAELAVGDHLADGALVDCVNADAPDAYALSFRDSTLGDSLRELFPTHRPTVLTTHEFLNRAEENLEWDHRCVLQLEVRGDNLGTVVLFRDASRPPFSPDDIDLAEQLLRRAAGAVDRAWLFADLQKAVRVRDDFLSIASHELRTPLTALELQLGNLARLMHKPDPLTWHQRFSDKLDRANRQTSRLTKLIDNLLDVSRISLGRFRLEPEDCDMAHLCQDVGERWMGEAGTAGCQLQLDLETPCAGRWDPLRMEQVFTNLISNAVKYGAGKPICLSLRGSESQILISVADQGIGVAADSLERIFDRFERAVTPREFSGLGLGLFITREIIEAHGGTISVRSILGTGSTFEVTLPRYVEASAPQDAASFLAELEQSHSSSRDTSQDS